MVGGCGIVELDGAQAGDVEKPARSLCRVDSGEGVDLGQKLVRLVIQVGLEVGAEEEVDDGDLEDLVLAQLGRLADSEERPEALAMG